MDMLEYDLPAGFEPPSIALPRHQTAIIQDAEGKAVIRHDVSLPVPEPHMVIVKTVAVSINPCDWKMPSRFPSPGARIGCDFSGIIVAIGPKVERLSRKLKLGDRVCGGVHGSNPIDLPSGSFAQYVAAHGDLLFKLPEHIRWESGAVLGASVISTLSIVLYKSLQLTATPDKPFSGGEGRIPHVLVYGGSTSTGTMALQLLRLSGYKPITTCSPRNHELVRSFGAEAVFDYRSPTCAEDIRTYTSRSLSRVLDIITDARSQTVCGNAFGRAGGLYTVLELPDPESPLARRRTVKTEMVVGLAATGKEIALGDGYERSADPAIRRRAAHDFQVVQRLLDEKRFRTHPARVVRGGFEGVLDGLKILRDMGTSGEKLVCFLDEAAEKLYFTESQV